jgi:hypothetical protein
MPMQDTACQPGAYQEVKPKIQSRVKDEQLVHFLVKNEGKTVGCLWITAIDAFTPDLDKTKFTTVESQDPNKCPRCSKVKKAKVA